VIYALLIVLAVGGISSGVLAALWQGAKAALIKARADLATQVAATTAADKAAELSEAARTDERARMDAVVTSLNKEIADLEANLPRDPAAVRNRLNELLGPVQPTPPVPSRGGSIPPYGGVSK
jgi:hypothetical protein